MPDAIITSTASTFGTISGTFAADQSTISGTVSGIITGTLSGSVGVPGPAGSPGAPGPGVPVGGTAGQYLQKIDGTNYNTDWVTLNLSGYALLSGANFTGRVTVPGITGDEIVNFPGFNIVPTQTEPTDKVDGDLWVYDDEGDTPSKFRVFLAGNTYNVATESWVSSLYAPLASPVFTGDPRAPTPASGDNDTSIATTAFVKAQGYAPLASPAFTGNPTAPTAALADNDTSIATTAFVQQELLSGTANARNLEVYVRNQTGSTIPAGSIVYINGATGNRPTITLAQANNDANSAQTFGFTKTAIANNGFGFVIVRGELENIDTSALTEGVQLYLSPTTAGAYTTTKPSAPQHLVYVGICVRAHPTQGVILVAVQNGYELPELHDVSITSVANNDLLAYESSTDLWKNKTFSALGLLTSADAATTYAPLASPALTGTPTAPTATLGTNTTQIATTAFVLANGGSPTFATAAQLIAASSTTTVVSPNGYRMAGLTTNIWAPNVINLSSLASGTGSNIGSGYTAMSGRLLAPNAATAGYATRGFMLHFPSNNASLGAAYNFSTESGHAVRVYAGGWSSTAAGVKMRGVFGRMSGSIPVPATLAARAYGWEWNWATRTMNIIAHNGTTLTTTAVTWNPISSRTYEITCTSNGAGTISLYVDGVLLGTSSGGPTGLNNASNLWWQLEIQNEATAGGQFDCNYQNPKVYTTNG